MTGKQLLDFFCTFFAFLSLFGCVVDLSSLVLVYLLFIIIVIINLLLLL